MRKPKVEKIDVEGVCVKILFENDDDVVFAVNYYDEDCNERVIKKETLHSEVNRMFELWSETKDYEAKFLALADNLEMEANRIRKFVQRQPLYGPLEA